MLPTGVVTFSHNIFEYVGGMFVAKCLPFDVEAKIPGIGHEFKTFLHLADYSLAVFHFHDECSVTLEKCYPVPLWMLKVEFDEARPMLCYGV